MNKVEKKIYNPTAFISEKSLINNIRLIKEINPYSRLFPVVKANAYGHGIDIVSKIIDPVVEGFAVARLDEAQEIRSLGYKKPIIIMSPSVSKNLKHYKKYNFLPVIHNKEILKIIEHEDDELWFKVDTGMHRLGLNIKELNEIDKQYKNMTIMSHFQSAQKDNLKRNIEQLKYFFKRNKFKKTKLSWDNSSTILQSNFHNYYEILKKLEISRDMEKEVIRPGIMIYGIDPLDIPNKYSLKLEPIMTLCAPIISIRKIEKGESVGYNGIWTAKKESIIATIGIGYGDGYPRSISKKTSVLIDNHKIPIIGEISMDTICIDITKLINKGIKINIGDAVELWGKKLKVNEIAKNAGTIPYELLSKLMPRVERVITKD